MLLVRCRPAKELVHEPLALRGRPLPGGRADHGEGGVNLGNRQCGILSRQPRVLKGRPADPDLPLRQFTGQVSDDDRHLIGTGRPQGRDKGLDLAQPRARRAHLPRHQGNLRQQHPAIVPLRFQPC